MKKQNLLAGLALLFSVLLTLGAAQAQVRSKFHGIASPGRDSILSRTDGAAQQNQAQVPSTPQRQYMVIELGGRRANDISQSGQIVGNKDFAPGIRHSAFWPGSPSAPIDLGSLSDLNSTALAINPRRNIVGYAFNDDSSVERPLFWASPNSAPVELPGLPAGLLGEVYDINPSGKIVGAFLSADFSVQQAVSWPNSNAAAVYLHQLSDEFPHSLASGINASGNILGDGCDANFVECHADEILTAFVKLERAIRKFAVSLIL